MHKQIFVNLAVDDLPKSKAFFEALGLSFDPRFTNEQGACLVIGENIHAMLLTRAFFKTFIDKDIADPRQTTEVLTCLSCDTRAEVDTVVANAVKAGGKAHRQPQDHGFMYARGFEDLDGHIWELAFMEMSAVPPQ